MDRARLLPTEFPDLFRHIPKESLLVICCKCGETLADHHQRNVCRFHLVDPIAPIVDGKLDGIKKSMMREPCFIYHRSAFADSCSQWMEESQ